MAFSLTTLSDALQKPKDSVITVTGKVLEISDFHEYKNNDNETRRYKVIRIADCTANVQIRTYNQKMIDSLEAGRSFLFTNLYRKQGEHCMWAVKTSGLCEWAPLEIPENIINSSTDTTVTSRTSLAEAMISNSLSHVAGKILQTSPVKYVNEGETPLRFLRLLDEPEGPRVKVALFGNDATKDYSVGEVISLTETYRYKDTNTLSTKKTCKLEFLPSNTIDINIDNIVLPEDKDFQHQTVSTAPEEFTVMGVASAQVYECCPNSGCKHKKIDSAGVCPECKRAPLTEKKYYCSAMVFIMRHTKEIVQHKLFLDQLQRLFNVPQLNVTSNEDFKIALMSQIPLNARGTCTFKDGSLKITNAKRKIQLS